MIGNVNALGRGFKGVLAYLATGPDGLQRDRVAWMEMRNLPTRDPELAACFMAATADLSVRTQKPVYHLSVSFDLSDEPDREMMQRVADRTLRDLGLLEHEAVVVAHHDRAHPHLHFVVNRVHPERGTAWSASWDYARIERSLRAQEAEWGLRVVPGKHAPAPGLERARPGRPLERGDEDFVRSVVERAVPVLERARSWEELERGLSEHGLSVRVKGRGMVLTEGHREVKASEVGRAFSRHHLERRFGPYPDYRARMAVAASVIHPRAPEAAEPPLTEIEPSQPAKEHPRPAPEPVVPKPRVEVTLPTPAVPEAPPAQPAGTRRSEQLSFPLPEHPVPTRSAPAGTSATPPVRPSPNRVDPPARPLTDRERYRAGLTRLTQQLAALYHDPRSARRAFAADVVARGGEAVRTLLVTPEAYGALHPGASRETAEVAGRWGQAYAAWQAARTRPAARRAAEWLRLGGRIEEADSALHAALDEAHRTAGVPARLAERHRAVEATTAVVREELRKVYADHERALESIQAHRRSHGQDAALRMVRENPEHFGALRADEKTRWVVFVARDTNRAKLGARILADRFDAAYAALRARPGPGDEERAREAIREAQAAVKAAQRARDALPRTTPAACQREAAAVIREAARGTPETAERIARQLGPMLSVTAMRLARRALELAEGPEREREHPRGMSL